MSCLLESAPSLVLEPAAMIASSSASAYLTFNSGWTLSCWTKT